MLNFLTICCGHDWHWSLPQHSDYTSGCGQHHQQPESTGKNGRGINVCRLLAFYHHCSWVEDGRQFILSQQSAVLHQTARCLFAVVVKVMCGKRISNGCKLNSEVRKFKLTSRAVILYAFFSGYLFSLPVYLSLKIWKLKNRNKRWKVKEGS